MNMGAVLTI